MPSQPLFAGLVVDEMDRPVETAFIGGEPAYVVNDSGFRRHIPSVDVDRQVLEYMKNQIKGNEDVITEQTAKMLGQDDLFTFAMIANQLKNLDGQFDALIENGIPESGRQYLGMMGFKVVINLHGEVLQVVQPSSQAPDEGGDE